MKNAYEILQVPQDANKIDIVKGQILAMKSGKYSSRDIAIAQKQLTTPSQRLAVDFTLPVYEKITTAAIVNTKIKIQVIDINKISPNQFDSLK